MLLNSSLAKQQKSRLPQAGSVIAASFASPIDPVYLAAVFDPIFTASYPRMRKVEQLNLRQAIRRALQPPRSKPSPSAELTDIATLLNKNPGACIVVLPECTTTNGRAILPLSPSLLSTPSNAKIYPVNLRYTPADVTTPVPGDYARFAWNLGSRPTHCIRVRLAEYIYNKSATEKQTENGLSGPYDVVYPYVGEEDDKKDNPSTTDRKHVVGSKRAEAAEVNGSLTDPERETLDRIADALARLGRVGRVSLTVQDKEEYVRLRLGKK